MTGRVLSLHLDPLNLSEIAKNHPKLEELLLYGSLPEILLTKGNNNKEELLNSYVAAYLQEEIMAEALVRSLSHFARFLELAAAESGFPINFRKLSQEVGVAHTTIAAYYNVLEDCLIIERIEPLTKTKTRRRLTKIQKYLFFDMGVRRIAACESAHLPKEYYGHMMEQFIGLELIRQMRLRTQKMRLRYWRDTNGPEIDWVIDTGDQYIPIEVKWTETPTEQDTRHLSIFLKEYSEAQHGYVICRTPHRMKIKENITALPWQALDTIFEKFSHSS